MKRKLFFAVLTAIGMSVPFPADAQNAAKAPKKENTVLQFSILKHGNYGDGAVTGNGENGFSMSLKNTAPRNHVIARANFRQNAAAQEKLVFLLKGSEKNGNAFLNISLLYEKGKKWIEVSSPRVLLRNREFKTYVFGLDTDFKLGDAVYPLRQIKFVMNGDPNPQGSVAEIEVRDVRIVSADEISRTSADLTIVPFPVPAPRTKISGHALKVYFDFDNDDRSPLVKSRVSHGEFQDRISPWSYRQLLLEHADGLILDAETPEESDVIVYSRAGKGKLAARIARAVRNGKRLILYGKPADPEIAALAPAELKAIPQKGFSKRQSLKVAAGGHSLLKGIRLTGNSFGVYNRAALKEGASAVLTFADGSPFLAERKNVMQINAGIGNRLDESESVFYDRFLLRAIALSSPELGNELDQRDHAVRKNRMRDEQKRVQTAAEAAGLSAAEAEAWRLGQSAENMGRFGWLIGEPLLVESLGKDLSVSNDTQQYSFATDGVTDLPFRQWSRKAVQGKITFSSPATEDADPCEAWNGIGIVEYETSLKMDPSWKGKSLLFEVRDGIDDVDEFLLNGRPVGKTGVETPYYWMAPRRYRIPQELIRWGEENRFTVRVQNLRDSAKMNSRPILRITDGTPKELLSVSRINWTGKSYRIQGKNGTRELTISLLTPFLRFRFPGRETFLNLENIAEFAAYQTAQGIRIVPLKENGVFYRKSKDGAWNAPWLLLFRSGKHHPLLVVFSNQPEELSVRTRKGNVEGIGIRSGKAIGTLATGRPWGAREVDCGNGKTPLSADVVKQIRLALNLALNYPVSCEEIFRIDRKKNVVDILNVFQFERTRDEWNTPVREFAFLPPLCGFMAQEKRQVRPQGTLTDFGIPTVHGPLLGVLGRRAVRYTLPLPPEDDLMPVGVRDETLLPAMNHSFQGGSRWSCGGRVPVGAWTPEYPAGRKSELRNVDPFAWNFGICSALQGALFLNGENRIRLEERTRLRYLEPLELYQYKNFARHREEPFSHLRYPILFNSFYPNTVTYSGEMGSTVIYGDSNEACTVAVWIARQLADGFGQADPIRLNWNYLQYAMRYQTCIDDYAFLSGSCRETGVGAWVDMLNGEYSGMLAYARLAQLNGNFAEQDRALYLAARKAAPTLARLFFHRYFETIRPEFAGKKDYQIVGFGEDGAKYMRFPNNNGNFFAANDLFDYSQGFPGQLILLYQKEGEPEVENHLKLRAIPLLMKDRKKIRNDYIPALAVFAKEFPLMEQAKKTLSNYPATGDWPGIRVPAQIGMVLWNRESRISLRDWRELNIHSAWYDPETRTLTLSAEAGPRSSLVFSSEKSPRSARSNGKTIPLKKQNNGWAVPLTDGENRIRIEF